MSSKYERMTDLYFQALNEILEPENWSRFLTTACRNFRLSFHEQVMLYAQKSDATAVLPIEGHNGWNRRFGRWVNRGAKGIAMFDGQYGVRYFFDIADTHESAKAKPVPIWDVHQEDVDAVTEALETRFGSLNVGAPLGAALISAAANAVEDHFQDYLAALLECKTESNLDVLDAESVEAMFRPLLQNSVGYMLLVRCGVDPELYFQAEDFRYIGGFNTLQTLNALRTAVSDISAMCLSEIARTALRRQHERENHTFAESSEKKYSVVRNQKNEPERGEEHESHHLHEAGGLSSSEPDSADISAGAWEIRKNAPQVPDGTPESDLYESADQRAALPPSDGDRADRPEPNGADGLSDGPGPGSDGGSESRRPNEVGGPDEQHPGIGRGTDFSGADLRIDEIPPLPSVEEQISFLGGGFVLPEQDGNQQSLGQSPLETAKELIHLYCQETFEQDADYSNLAHVDLAYGSTSDSQHTVEIFADLTESRLVYQVDKETVHEVHCENLSELNSYLANLDFDTMIADAEEQYQKGVEDSFDDIDPEQIRQNLEKRGIVSGKVVDPEALNRDPFIRQVMADAESAKEPASNHPKTRPKREHISFESLYPEIPKAQRSNFRIIDPELGNGTAAEKYNANVLAIRTLKRIEDETRLASPEEQEILSRYVGWGGLADCFDEKNAKYSGLKALLTEEEFAAARASALTAFYTSPTIIHAMYQALEQMGFREGNILEPSCGVGNFIGMIPDTMAGSHAYGVELDSISGRIAQQLYQNSSIAVTGFEKVQMPDSFFDVAIGNIPFGDFKVLDKRYDKHHWLIHDFFFGKALDKVRPGGIVAFITSKGTMDKGNPAVRKYLAQRADLIGAIRLPNTAFKHNAGTEVTSDILFLQKRDHMTDIEPDWVHLDTDANGIRLNIYFVQHPEMILGEMVMESTRFGMDSVCRADENANLSELLQRAIQNLHSQITEYQHDELEEEDHSIPADPSVRNFSFCVVNGKVYFRENSRMSPVELSVTAENRIRGMMALRDCVRQLIDYQTEGYPDEDIQKEQARLNTLYDDYTRKYGLLSSRGNSLAFGEDSSYFLLCSLEVLDEEGNFKRKADMFAKRTIRPHVAVTSVDTASEALAVSIAEKARVDMPFMAELSGKTEIELETELAGVIFRNVNCAENPEEIPLAFVDLNRFPFVTADEYLSGNVRRKLRMVKALQGVLPPEKKENLERNVEALTAVQPVDLTAGEIGVRIGVNWVPKEVYEQFLFEVIGTSAYARDKIHVLYSPHTGEWNVTGKSMDGSNIKAFTTYGTKRINAYHIFEQTLNQKDVRIFDTKIDADGNEVRVLNKKETAIAQDRQELIKAKFAEWVWKDIDRRERLCSIYNETFNAIRPREYDGQHIRFSGMNPEITLRKHQVNAIAHIMYGGNTLLAHEVGAGKTFEIVAAAMESKRLGLCTKSLIVVPNHITEQWASEWLQLYPSANILVATKKDFETKNRKKFCARIATGDYDAIIIGHSQFEKIPMSRERQEAILKRQINGILDSIREAKRNHAENYSIKQMERTRKSLENRLAKLNDQSRKDDVVTFEQLGVDRIFVDESHYFKNLFLATKMRNVGGIAQTEAQKSSDLFMKCQYLDEITGGRGVVFATGTPISNSMVELYTIQRYLQYVTLEEMGLINFDDWAANYGETVTAIELSPEGYTLIGR